MKISKKAKIILILLCLFLITGCGVSDNKNEEKVSINQEEVNLGDACSTCKSYCMHYGGTASSCESSCASSCGGGGNNNGGSRPTETEAPVVTPAPLCKAGEASSDGRQPCKKCSGKLEYTNTSGRTSCSKCGAGYMANSDHTDCVPAPITSLSITGAKNIYLALDEKYSRTFTAKTYEGVTLGTVTWSGPGAGHSLSTSGTTATMPFTGDVGVYSWSVTASSGGKSANQSGTTTKYNCTWSAMGINEVYKSPHPAFINHLYNSGCDFFDPAGVVRNSKGGVGYRYSGFHSRCCHTSYPPSDFGGCYGDEPYRGIATEVAWSIMDEPSGRLKYRYDEISNKGDCVLMEQAKTCVSTDYRPDSVTKTTTSCEGDVNISFTSDKSICASDSTQFYKIVCDTNVDTSFDMDDHLVNNNNELYKGQGFKYNIGVKETITCRGTFYPAEWNSSYKKIKARIETVKSPKGGTSFSNAWEAYKSYRSNNNPKIFENYVKELQSRDEFTDMTWRYIYEHISIAESLEGMVNDYNNYEPPEETIEETNLTMTYKLIDGGKIPETSISFDRSVESCKPSKTRLKEHHLENKPSWIKNPADFRNIYSKTVNLYPKDVLISKDDGKIVDSNKKVDTTRVLDGGNKIYIDNNAAPQNIPLKIVVSNLARNGSKITNNKCSIKIYDTDLLYRPIELSNPFINKSWNKGDNWTNSLYDFTNTIHTDTWSRSPLYTIDLPNSMVGTVRRSNINNKSAYLGLCDKLDRTNQDEATRFICNFLK